MQSVDQVIRARWVVPVRPRIVLHDHALAVQDGRIIAIGPAAEILTRYTAASMTHLDQHVLMPGLVNAHTHAAMTLMRGLADDLPLMTWLNAHIWPVEGRFVSPEFVAIGTELAVAEMLRGGTTTFNDMYFFPEAAAEVAQRMGMRATIGHVVIDFPTAYAANADVCLQLAADLLPRLRRMPLIHQSIAPHAPYTVGDAGLCGARELAASEKLPLHMHVHETAHEIDEAIARDGMRPLARLARLGLLNQHFLAVHMTQLNEEDLAICRNSGLRIAHCPESNLKLASGMAPVATLRKQGTPLAIGTDGAASNNDLDMLGELRTAALLAKGVSGDPTAFPAWEALEAATLGGAEAIGWGAETGSLEPGKAADCIAIDLDHPATYPVYDPVSQVVYCAGRDQVSHVWVNGNPRVVEGRAVDWDTQELFARVRGWVERIREKDSDR
ncbi:N-ethylammeline chlorohydrolase [Acidithiobacillus ferridurans]|uniref:TRZ/ATZ family hydrolase n=1 Tax=Acidithiobacillus ferridurans TaxID=1232575 RepID=UPI000DE56219|nr:TRZ/ATZ family hydrolase [Acidithiobacillus ferridurans]RBM03432.1 N-ethylammeline chlorohydrolase [Acidithiobacillus ferridurans]